MFRFFYQELSIPSFFSRLAARRCKEQGMVGISPDQEEDAECLQRDANRQDLIEKNRKTGYEGSCKITEKSLMAVTKTNATNMEDDQNQHDHLRQFVSDECKAQATERSDINPEDAPLDAERMNNFYQRALKESERMSNEVKKSHIQRSELHKELGADMFASWTNDHAQQVLSTERYELWQKEEEKAKKALQQLESTSLCDDESSDDASQ